jgi:hypothetical protein
MLQPLAEGCSVAHWVPSAASGHEFARRGGRHGQPRYRWPVGPLVGASQRPARAVILRIDQKSSITRCIVTPSRTNTALLRSFYHTCIAFCIEKVLAFRSSWEYIKGSSSAADIAGAPCCGVLVFMEVSR